MEKSITEDAISLLPLKQFEGLITVVENAEHVPAVVAELMQYPVIGFDTETKPAFKKGTSNKVALLQLSTSDKAYLFRVNKMGLHSSLVQLFQNADITKVGVAVRDDLKALIKLSPFNPQGFVELQLLAKKNGFQDASLKKLTALLCQFRISKRQRLSNWESKDLTESQLVYAATDAWAALKIFEKLSLNGNAIEHHIIES